MSEQWIETCRCGASLKLIGWSPFPNDKTSAEKAAEKWRKYHRCKNPYI